MEEASVVREGWNGYNVFHDSASRVAALDVGFLPSARAASAPPAKFVYLLGSDDYKEEDISQDAFVVYQVPLLCQYHIADLTTAQHSTSIALTLSQSNFLREQLLIASAPYCLALLWLSILLL